MITLQHTSIYVLGAYLKRNISEDSSFESKDQFKKSLHSELPWVLLPDAIRAYIGPRQVSHFEKCPEGHGKDCSWIKFPSETILKELSKETVKELVSYELKDGYPACVIGEETNIGEFDIKNGAHKHYEALRCHMIQDMYLDETLRLRMIDASQRFSDKFVIRHNKKEIDGKELRAQVALFEQLGFIKLVGIVYERTGILLNREWFDKYVLTALQDAYPADLAANTYKYMSISDEVNERINALQFELTAEEKESVYITDDLDRVLDELYAYSIRATRFEV